MGFSEIVQLIVNLIAAPTALITIIFLIMQARQLDQTLRSQVYQGLIDNSLKIDQLLIEHPEFRKYIYEGEAVNENTPEIEKLMSLMEFVVDIVDNLGAQERYIPKSLVGGWRAYAQDVMRSPAASYFLQKHGHWYTSGMPATTQRA